MRREQEQLSFTFDAKLAMQKYEERKAHYAGKQIDNSSLPAGSPMYFFCKFCGAPTDTLPEGYFLSRPKMVCDPCEMLHVHGLI